MVKKKYAYFGYSVALIVAIFIACNLRILPQPILSRKELPEVLARAQAGSAEDAYNLYWHYAISTKDRGAAARWLRASVNLNHPAAQKTIAGLIKEGRCSYEEYGSSRQVAVRNLLEKASLVDGDAAYDLGLAYAEGYFGKVDMIAARVAFLKGASLNNSACWEKAASMLHQGVGGEIDNAEAYYWIGLACRWTYVHSTNGKELWKLRCQIESQLSLDQMKTVWKRLDLYIQKERKREGGRVYPPAFLGTAIPSDEWRKYCMETDGYEIEHRKKVSGEFL
jgi:hypothetical protein